MIGEGHNIKLETVMYNIELQTEGARIILDFGTLDISAVEARVREILPLLQYLVSADSARANLRHAVQKDRLLGIAAQDMMSQAALGEAIRHAQLLGLITEGKQSIADHGFPEFESKHNVV
jgi:hypothetical protein